MIISAFAGIWATSPGSLSPPPPLVHPSKVRPKIVARNILSSMLLMFHLLAGIAVRKLKAFLV
jgi:hypothetical protein